MCCGVVLLVYNLKVKDMRYMENNNVTVLRLYSGEMIIGTEDLREGNSEKPILAEYRLKDPRTIVMVPTMRGDIHIAMKPICAPFAVKRLEKEIAVPFGQVMFKLDQSEIDKELVNGYKSEISGIKIASATDTMAISANKQQGSGEFIL